MESLLRKAREAREFLTPVLKSSKFLSEGILTPDEFVKAGDNLVFKCPTWRWEAGDPRHRKAYLPADKQYLATRGVPCRSRVSVMEAEYAKTAATAAILDDDPDPDDVEASSGSKARDDWTVLSEGDKKQSSKKKKTEAEANAANQAAASSDGKGAATETATAAADAITAANNNVADAGSDDDSDDDSDYLDMEAFEEQNLVQPDAAAVPALVGGNDSNQTKGSSNIEKTRTYDLTMTYDNYYKTPRVWLFGFDQNGSPLPSEQIFEDIAVDYRKRTVTIDPHPHLHNVMHASIHPCKHAAVMKKIVGAMLTARANAESEASVEEIAGGHAQSAAPSVEAYLFIFLKFIQSVVPTIDYDFTMSVSFNLNQKSGD